MTKIQTKKSIKKSLKILGIDPGIKGAFILYDGGSIKIEMMPVFVTGKGKDKIEEVNFGRVVEILETWEYDYVFCERAKPMAMGSKYAFNYGRYYAALQIAIESCFCKATFVDPSVWAKEMHKGLDTNLKAKAKSLMAVNKLFPNLVAKLPMSPRSKKLHDGPIDALLIAAYGYEKLTKTR